MLHADLGASLYKTWSAEQQRDEIAKLVEGYRAGLPVLILCRMTEAIAGSRKRAREILHELMTPEERQEAAGRETGEARALVLDFLR
ncbi:hypothetical protein [Geobacter pickeringii]|uniref:Uncharacterized protein n=1 Tax=Geobacter pickeringii TaxID=345632 RepID=A0A0B5BDJ7_9BACT|nr:hypothetical protein [Geobacter pickeringii]AJE03209.1 hypothetical protein GPICK_07420 [Geobacter pickeringii]